MIKLAIVSSKKYLKSKQAVALVSYLDNQKIIYEKILVESQIQQFKNDITYDLIVSVGGDGTALKAMTLGWNQSVPVLNLGSGRVGYLVNSLENIDFDSILKKILIILKIENLLFKIIMKSNLRLMKLFLSKTLLQGC